MPTNLPSGSSLRIGSPSTTAQHDLSIPRSILLAAGAMMLATIIFALIARTTDIGAVRFEPGAALESRDLRFVTMANGDLAVQDARDGATLDVLPAKRDGFVKIILRSAGQERNLAGIGADQPFRLSRLQNDQIIFEDLSTGRKLLLTAFGGPNEAVFSKYLASGSGS